jgi:large subunit ribosomal protein L31
MVQGCWQALAHGLSLAAATRIAGGKAHGIAAKARSYQNSSFGVASMKEGIHPKYYPDAKVFYRGEVVMTVGATVPELHVEIWSGSHPFFTGQKSFVDTAGRVEKFQKKFQGNYFKKEEKGKDAKADAKGRR